MDNPVNWGILLMSFVFMCRPRRSYNTQVVRKC